MNIVLIGAPGSGKGTLGAKLEKAFGYKHISVGKLMREEAKTNAKIKETINNGALVDNKTIKQILQQRLKQADCYNGYILDGYPRSLLQAKDLVEIAEIDYVIFLKIKEEEIYNRLTNRLSCTKCNSVYDKRAENINICKNCGGNLEVRSDDNLQTIKKRLKVFNQNKKQLLEFFENQVLDVPADGTPEEVFEFVSKILKEGAKKVGC